MSHLLVVLMCRLFLKWCALQRLPQLARQRTCVLAMVAKDGGCCAGSVDAVVFLLAMMQFSMQICTHMTAAFVSSCRVLCRLFSSFIFLVTVLYACFFHVLIHNLNTGQSWHLCHFLTGCVCHVRVLHMLFDYRFLLSLVFCGSARSFASFGRAMAARETEPWQRCPRCDAFVAEDVKVTPCFCLDFHHGLVPLDVRTYFCTVCERSLCGCGSWAPNHVNQAYFEGWPGDKRFCLFTLCVRSGCIAGMTVETMRFLTCCLVNTRSSFHGFWSLLSDYHCLPNNHNIHKKLAHAWVVSRVHRIFGPSASMSPGCAFLL